MSFNIPQKVGSIIEKIGENIEDGDKIIYEVNGVKYHVGKQATLEKTDQAPQAAVASTSKNNQNELNPKKKSVKKSSDPYTIAREVIENILGDKEDLKNYPCHVSLYHAIHVTKKPLEWSKWTADVKKLLVEELFNLHGIAVGKTDKKVFPNRKFSKALRIEMNRLYPEIFGYGLMFNRKKLGAGPYTKYKKRLGSKKPDAHMDAVFWSIQEMVATKSTKLRNELDKPRAVKTARKCPTQRSTKGFDVLNEWGLLCLYRSPNEAERGVYKELTDLCAMAGRSVHTILNKNKIPIAYPKIEVSALVCLEILSVDEELSKTFDKVRHLRLIRTYMKYCSILFDHKDMEEYITEKIQDAKPIIKQMLKEDDKLEKLEEIIRDNDSDFYYVIEGLNVLLNVDSYFNTKTHEAMDDEDLCQFASGYEDPVLWVQVDDEFAVILEHSIVLRYPTYEESFMVYVTSFSVFNVSWSSIIQVLFSQIFRSTFFSVQQG